MPAYPQDKPISSQATVNVNTAVADFTVLAANVKRKSFIIANRSGVTVYFRYSAAATLTLFAFQLLDGQIYEPPAGFCPTDIIHAISGSAVANGLCVTEIY